MAIIRPFRGVRYNQDKAGDLDCLVTPPYDVISPDDRVLYEKKSPYNFVRLILPQDEQGKLGSKYKISADTLCDWMKEDILHRDDEPSFYACVQEFDVKGETTRRTGFTCLVRLEDFSKGKVLPHENILAKPLEDRLNLTRETRANFDSVFGLFSDGRVNNILMPFVSATPDAVATDKDGVKCSIFKISDTQAINAITDALADQSIVIADGHHRYTAALTYRDEMREKNPDAGPDAPWEFVLMTLVSMEDPGLVVFPTHRLVSNLENYDPKAFMSKLGELFDITEVPAFDMVDAVDSLSDEHYVFGIYTGGNAYMIQLKSDIKPEEEIETPGSDALKKLDVSVLHSLILDRLLGIDVQSLSKQSNLSYTRDPQGAMKSVDAGESQIFIYMNPTRVEEVKEVAAAGDRMPQKSTFFYPKLLTGMVTRVMDNGC